ETPTDNALVAQDGIRGYDWSYQAEEEHPTNFALMTHTSLGSSSSSDSNVDSCSKSCVTAYATLKEQYDSLSSDYRKSQFNLVSYKAASSTAASPAVESFVNSSEMLENQENNKSKSDKGYHAVPPPFTGNFVPHKPDLTFMDEIVESENLNVTTVVTPAVLTRSGKINTAGASVNTAVRPVNTAGSKTTVNHPRPISNAYKKGYSQVTRPFNKYSTNKNSTFNKKVNTVRVKDTVARDRAVVSEIKGKGVNVVKASACWVWKAKKRILGKFDGKADDGFFVGYSVEYGPDWLFDVDSLTISMNYVPIVVGNQTNGIAGTRDNILAVSTYIYLLFFAFLYIRTHSHKVLKKVYFEFSFDS
ncbi:hypothetical protein Tco_1577927, partial [Tanacetum coccineum]